MYDSRLRLSTAKPQAAPSLHLDDLGDNTRDVIARSLVQSELAEAVRAFLHVALLLHEGQELIVGDDATQAVGTEQEPVAGLQLHDLHVRPFADLGAAEV